MKMKYITLLREGDVDYDVYYDVFEDKYYKVNGEEKIELEGESLLCAQVADDYLHKVVSARRRKKTKKYVKLIACLLAGSLAIGGLVNNFKDEISYVMEEQTAYGDYTLLGDFARRNVTIEDDVLKELKAYFDVFVQLGVDEINTIKIANRLESEDFRGVDALNIMHRAMGLDDNGFLAKEMHYYIKGIAYDYNHGLISNLFINDRDSLMRLFKGDSLTDIVKKKFGVKVDFTDLNEETIKILESLNARVAKEVLQLEDTDKFQLNNNVFNRYIRIKYETFNIYIDFIDGKVVDKTEEEYTRRLYSLINTNGSSIDYQDVNDRFLVYLYANALLNGNPSDYSLSTVEFLFSGTQNKYSSPNIDVIVQSEMYTFLDNKYNFDYSYLPLFYQLAYYAEEGLAVLQEVNLCLKEEVEVGNLSQEAYDEFIETVISILSSKDIEYLEKFVDASLKGKSIDGYQLQLINDPEIV